MRLLLVHLSDMHIRGPQDAILQRHGALVDAVKNLDYSLNGCVLVVTGDIAWAGEESQLTYAWEFLDSIKTDLSKKLSNVEGQSMLPVYMVAIPGNHDCKFQNVGKARDFVISGVTEDPNKDPDESTLEVCTGIQDHFFDCLDVFANKGLRRNEKKFKDRLYYEYFFHFQSSNVRFLCFNTAWVSKLHETPGTLIFPESVFPKDARNDELTIALLHHNLIWFEPTISRALRKKLEASVDIILTGHEHDSTRRTTEGGTGEHNIHIEGGALHDPEYSTKSTFNALVVDTAEKKQKFVCFEWNGQAYIKANWIKAGDDGGGIAWEDFTINRLRQSGIFILSQAMENQLNDPGVTLTHRAKGVLKLSDIFVYPDLRELAPYISETQQLGHIISGEKILSIIEKKFKLLIVGDSQSGKTCLGKRLFLELHKYGYVPIFLDGSKRYPSGDKIYGYLEKIYCEQYEEKTLNSFLQLERSKRVIIVDDYHLLSQTPKDRRKILEHLEKFAKKVVLLASDLVLINDLTIQGAIADQQVDYCPYRIMQFGYAKRNLLVEKWVFLETEKEFDGEEVAHQVVMISTTLNTIIGKNFVPAFPVYILSVLQGAEAGTPIDTRASTHGYFYELLIRETLSRGRSKVDYDIRSTYLSNLAFSLFKERKRNFDYPWLRDVHQSYEKEFDIQRSCDKYLQDFLDQYIFEREEELYKFKYKYLYYYFVASYLRDRITEGEIQMIIGNLCRELYVEENANILLFLAHLSKDPLIMMSLLEISGQLFRGTDVANFSEDIKFLGELKLEGDIAYIEKDPSKSRQEILERMDKAGSPSKAIDEQYGPADGEQLDFLDPLVKLNAALKTVQILGQFLKNFPGSIQAKDKSRIAQETYNLGLRCLRSFFDLVKENERGLLTEFIEIFRDQHPGWMDEDLEKRAKKTIVGMTQVVSFCLIKRISVSVGSPDLFTTFDRLLKENNQPSYKLIHASIKLDHSGAFPEEIIQSFGEDLKDNWLAFWLLRNLVVQHFDYFPVKYKVKQRICDKLSMPYKRLQSVDPKRRLIE